MSTRLQIVPDVLFQVVLDEAVLLNINDNHYYGLDDVATRMWQLLQASGDADVVVQQMLEEYEVDEATLRRDLASLVAEMEQRGLIQRVQS